MELQEKETNAVIDLAAIVFEVGSLQTINCQDGRTRVKRNETLVDDTCKQIPLGLWPDFTDQLNGQEGKAVVLQSLQLRDYLGKLMLSSTVNTIITTNDDHEKIHHLNQWFEQERLDHDYTELQ